MAPKSNAFLSSQLVRLGGLSILVFLFTFYHFSPSIETGLDPSYAFGLNYIFAHHIPFGTDIIYTYGPLGFLYFPQDIGNNLLLGILLVSCLRLLFIYVFLKLGSVINKELWLLHAACVFFICNFIYLDFVLVATVTCSLLLHFLDNKNVWLMLAGAITVVALFIKSSFGLMCASIVFSYALFDFYKTKDLKNSLPLLLSACLSFILIWILQYGNLYGVFKYLYGTLQLITGNSSAMILEVKNNWWLLSLFALLFFLAPVLMKDKGITLLYGISLLALYAAWKYAFSREENYHLKFFFDYLIVFSALFMVISKPFRPQLAALLLVSVFVFFQCMKATGMYTVEEEISFKGIKNFYRIAFQWQDFKAEAKAITEQNLQKSKLSSTFLSRIGTATIDFFPWELSYVAANNLNWKPRPNMQSGAYTPWLDKNNANFIASKNAPEFYLWEMGKPGGGVDCFDERYFLNDEPHTIFSLFNKYKIAYADSEQTLFQKSATLRFPIIMEGNTSYSNWNNWITVPEDSTAIVRIKAVLTNSYYGKIRKAFYKDILYYIDYKLENEQVKTYRIVRENAVNGLWVSPLVERISDDLKGKKVKFVRFRCSAPSLVENTISFQWQIITLAENQKKTQHDE